MGALQAQAEWGKGRRQGEGGRMLEWGEWSHVEGGGQSHIGGRGKAVSQWQYKAGVLPGGGTLTGRHLDDTG